MNRSTLKRILINVNAPRIAADIIGSDDENYNVEAEAVVERLRNAAAKLNEAANRVERGLTFARPGITEEVPLQKEGSNDGNASHSR